MADLQKIVDDLSSLTVLEAMSLVLFFGLFTWIAGAFWTAIAGFIIRLKGGDRQVMQAHDADGGGGVEEAFPPGMVHLTAALFDRLLGQSGGDVLAQSAQDGDDTRRHGRGPSGTRVGS